MKTLGEFKKAGLEIIKGDLIDGTTGDKNSKAVCPFVIAASALSIGQSGELFDGWTIRRFAWRTNTGVKPEFSGVVEVEGEFSSHFGRVDDFKYWWTDGTIKKWRPHLPKVEDKPKSPYDVDAHVSEANPVFTQAMADAGELPGEGSEFLIMVDVDWFEKASLLAIRGDKAWVAFSDSDDSIYSLSTWMIKPIQTEREKAIDDMYHTIRIHAKVKNAAAALYDAGYRKC